MRDTAANAYPVGMTRVSGYVAIAAPIAVMAVLLFQGVTTPGHDPIRQTISELGTGWDGTRIVALYGVVLLASLWHAPLRTLGARLSSGIWVAALIVIGMGCVGLGLVAAESGAWHSMSWPGRWHLVFAFVFVFGGIPAACLAASRALPRHWHGLRAYSLATALVCVVTFVGTLTAIGGSQPDPYVIAHLGLIERGYVFAFMTWQCIVSAALTRSPHKDTR